jgi:exonuclease SbcD
VVDAEAGAGILAVDFVATDVARWQQLVIDITGLDRESDLHAALQAEVRAAHGEAPERLLALRLTLRGRGPLHGRLVASREALRAQLAASINEASAGLAWLEKVRVEVSAPLDLARLATRDDPVGLLLRSLDALAADPTSSRNWRRASSPSSGRKFPPSCAEPKASGRWTRWRRSPRPSPRRGSVCWP